MEHPGNLEAAARFHDAVSEAAAAVAARHAGRLRCGRGCAACCRDGLTVFAVEADLIRARHAALLASGAPHPPGACAFLDAEGACRVYADRPYVCRTQGLPIRYFEEGEAGAVRELRDICPLNEPGGPPVTEIPAEDCWPIGPAEQRLALLQLSHTGRPDRVALRDLFAPGQARPR